MARQRQRVTGRERESRLTDAPPPATVPTVAQQQPVEWKIMGDESLAELYRSWGRQAFAFLPSVTGNEQISDSFTFTLLLFKCWQPVLTNMFKLSGIINSCVLLLLIVKWSAWISI